MLKKLRKIRLKTKVFKQLHLITSLEENDLSKQNTILDKCLFMSLLPNYKIYGLSFRPNEQS